MVDEVMPAVCGGGASTFRYRDFAEFAVAYAFPSASGRLERASLPVLRHNAKEAPPCPI